MCHRMTAYDLLKDLGAFAGLGFILKTAFASFRNRLRLPERHLLVAAAKCDGFIHYFNYPNLGGPWVRTGNLDLGDSPLTQAEFVDALNRLRSIGYVYTVENSLFALTSKGIRASQRLAKTVDFSKIPSGKREVGLGAAVG
jgi:hypothetical protein